MTEARVSVGMTADATGLKRGIADGSRAVSGFATHAGKLKAALAAAFSVAAVGAVGRAMLAADDNAVAYADKIEGLAREMGLARVEIQALDQAARDANLGGAEAFEGMISKIRDFQDQLRAGKDQGEAFGKMLKIFGTQEFMVGANKDFANMAPAKAFEALAQAMAAAKDDGEKVAMIFDIIGAKGRKMQSFLEDLGKTGISGFRSQYDALGASMTEQELRILAAADDRRNAREQRKAVEAARARVYFETQVTTMFPGDKAAQENAIAKFEQAQDILRDPMKQIAEVVSKSITPERMAMIASGVDRIAKFLGASKDEGGKY